MTTDSTSSGAAVAPPVVTAAPVTTPAGPHASAAVGPAGPKTPAVCVLRSTDDFGDDGAIRESPCSCGIAYGWTDSPEADYSPDCPQHGTAADERRAASYEPDAEVPF